MTSPTIIKDTTANPAPLGLVGFGLTTVLLNFHNVGLFTNDAMIMGMGIFVGGFAQLAAGWLESKKGNTFGTTAFLAFGLFWLSLVAVWVLPTLGWAAKPSSTAMAFYLAVWGLFTFGMFLGTFRLSHALQVVFGTLCLLFWLLALGDITGDRAVTQAAGAVGIMCGLAALYTAVAQVLNEIYDHTVLPVGPVAQQPARIADESAVLVRPAQPQASPSSH